MTTKIDPKRFQRGRQIFNDLTRRGISFELTEDGRDFDAMSYALDDAGEYIPIPSAVLEEIESYRELILEQLQYWERTIEKVTRIWLQHDPEYRARYLESSTH